MVNEITLTVLRFEKKGDCLIEWIAKTLLQTWLQSKLGTAPMTSLGIVLDRVVYLETDPLRKGSVLSLLFRESALGAKCLLRRLYSI